MSELINFIKKQISISIEAGKRVSDQCRNYQNSILKLKAITNYPEKELEQKIKTSGIGIDSFYHFYACLGRFPSTEECQTIKEIGIHEFVLICKY